MHAGTATEITEFDGWMYRNWWYELSRNRGWQSGDSSSTPTTTSDGTHTPTGSGDSAQQWEQCGGIGYSGPTECASPYACVYQNDYYSQCL